MKWIKLSIMLLVVIVVGKYGWSTYTQYNESKQKMEVIRTQMEQLTLEQKIAQMFIVSYQKESIDEQLESILSLKPGGFILFKDNFTTYENTLQLIETIKNSADIPMWIAVDQEGGRVQRLTPTEQLQATLIPSMAVLGKTKDTRLAYEVGTVISEELRVFDVNMDFAPVLDVVEDPNNQVIGDRSFGSDPNIVADMGISLGKGLEDHHVLAVYKHFPGHGATITDSHYELPVITKSKEELYAVDLVPFQKAIDQGAKVMMIGHLAVPSLTGDDTPASLSKPVITDLLKTKMGFQGLVITDALNMKALTDHYTEKQIYEMAISAGVDILLMPSDLERAITYVKESIQEGIITEEQINQSVEKILKFKYQYMKEDSFSKDILNSEEHQKIVSKISTGE